MAALGKGRASLLSVAHVAKSYRGVAALHDASLTLEAGEALGLMGENGAGKSTLIKILAGAVAPDGGTIALDGAQTTIASPRDAHRLGLRFIHQELNIVPRLSVAENLFLGRRYPTRFGRFVDWRRLNARATETLAALGVTHLAADAILARLPVGDRMLVKIAAAFLEDPAEPARLFVMDEPTAALAGEETERLFRIIAELRRRGCGILYVSHRIDEVLRMCSRITVLRDGRTTATLAAADATKASLIAHMIGRGGAEASAPSHATAFGRVALAVENFGDGDFRDVSFCVREGEILGVAGLANSGCERLLKALMGGAVRGRISVAGKLARGRSPADAWRRGFGYVPRERRAEGLFPLHDVTRNIVLPHLSWLSRARIFLDRRAERATADALSRRVRLKSTGLRQHLWRLSGGNQQKVIFARAVAGAPRVLLLDEPTRGVDIGAKFDIYALLRELAASGAAIVVASSDHAELLALAQRIVILRDGAIATCVGAEGLTQQRLLALCYGEAPP